VICLGLQTLFQNVIPSVSLEFGKQSEITRGLCPLHREDGMSSGMWHHMCLVQDFSRPTQYHIPEDDILHSRCYLKS
jgi:hypothetical protein